MEHLLLINIGGLRRIGYRSGRGPICIRLSATSERAAPEYYQIMTQQYHEIDQTSTCIDANRIAEGSCSMEKWLPNFALNDHRRRLLAIFSARSQHLRANKCQTYICTGSKTEERFPKRRLGEFRLAPYLWSSCLPWLETAGTQADEPMLRELNKQSDDRRTSSSSTLSRRLLLRENMW